MENTTLETIVGTGYKPTGIAIDSVHEYLYYANHNNGMIRRCNLDGTNAIGINNDGSIWAITVDLFNGYVVLITNKQ